MWYHISLRNMGYALGPQTFTLDGVGMLSPQPQKAEVLAMCEEHPNLVFQPVTKAAEAKKQAPAKAKTKTKPVGAKPAPKKKPLTKPKKKA